MESLKKNPPKLTVNELAQHIEEIEVNRILNLEMLTFHYFVHFVGVF